MCESGHFLLHPFNLHLQLLHLQLILFYSYPNSVELGYAPSYQPDTLDRLVPLNLTVLEVRSVHLVPRARAPLYKRGPRLLRRSYLI